MWKTSRVVRIYNIHTTLDVFHNDIFRYMTHEIPQEISRLLFHAVLQVLVQLIFNIQCCSPFKMVIILLHFAKHYLMYSFATFSISQSLMLPPKVSCAMYILWTITYLNRNSNVNKMLGVYCNSQIFPTWSYFENSGCY